MAIASIDEVELQTLLGAGKSVVADFHADWCHPCHSIVRELEELVSRFGEEIEFVKIDIDANPGLALSLRVMSIPTVIHFLAGKEIARSVGVAGADVLVSRLAIG